MMKNKSKKALIINSRTSSKYSKNMIPKSKRLCQQCKICGAPAFYTNFGVSSCSSCKMFFKRNAESGSKYLTCDGGGHCQMDINNRRTCSFCRLNKCFASGMQTELLRSARSHKNTKRQNKKIGTEALTRTSNTLVKRNGTDQPQQLPSLNLLGLDRSTLSISEWNLLSNLIHCYDEHSGHLMAHQFLSEQNSFPLKLRFKTARVCEFLVRNMRNVRRVLEKNGDYISLSLQDRSILLRNTVKHTVCIGGTFVLYKVQLLDDLCFYKSTEVIFGADVMSTIESITNSFDLDDTVVKLILSIVGFSTTNFTVYSNTAPVNLLDIKTIIRIQESYTELIWRYLIYKYTYEHAVICFSRLIRCLFNVNFTVVKLDRIQVYTNMINTVIEQAEQVLTLNN